MACVVVALLDHARLVVALPDLAYALAYASDRNFNSMHDAVSLRTRQIGERVNGVVSHVDDSQRTLVALEAVPAASGKAAARTADVEIVIGALVNGAVASVGQRFIGVAIGSRRGSEFLRATTHFLFLSDRLFV